MAVLKPLALVLGGQKQIAPTDQIAVDAGAMTVTETGGSTSRGLPDLFAAKVAFKPMEVPGSFETVNYGNLSTVFETKFVNGSASAGAPDASVLQHYFGFGGGDVPNRGAQMVMTGQVGGSLFYRVKSGSTWGAWNQAANTTTPLADQASLAPALETARSQNTINAAQLTAAAFPNGQSALITSASGGRWNIAAFPQYLILKLLGSAADWRPFFQNILGLGLPLYIPKGDYYFHTRHPTVNNMIISVVASVVDVECHPEAVFKVNERVLRNNYNTASPRDNAGAMFQFDTGIDSTIFGGQATNFLWSGGKIDYTENLATSPLNRGNWSGFDIFRFTQGKLYNVIFDAGTLPPGTDGNQPGGIATNPNGDYDHIGTGFADTFMTTHQCAAFTVEMCHAIGCVDEGCYLSGAKNANVALGTDNIYVEQATAGFIRLFPPDVGSFTVGEVVSLGIGTILRVTGVGVEGDANYVRAQAGSTQAGVLPIIAVVGTSYIRLQLDNPPWTFPAYEATSGKTYYANQSVRVFGGTTYRCITTHTTSDTTFVSANWTAMSTGTAPIAYEAVNGTTSTYAVGDQRYWRGSTSFPAGFVECTVAHSRSDGGFTTANWKRINLMYIPAAHRSGGPNRVLSRDIVDILANYTGNPVQANAHKVINCRFYRCQNGVTMKRNGKLTEFAGNWFFECGGSILSGTVGFTNGGADTDFYSAGKDFLIHDNFHRRISGNVITLVNQQNVIVHDESIVDFGHKLSNVTYTTAKKVVAAILMGSCSNCLVHDIKITQETPAWYDPAAGAIGDTVAGINLFYDGAGVRRRCDNNVFHDIRMTNVEYCVLEEGTGLCNNNTYHNVDLDGLRKPSVFQGTNQRFLNRKVSYTPSVTLSGGGTLTYDSALTFTNATFNDEYVDFIGSISITAMTGGSGNASINLGPGFPTNKEPGAVLVGVERINGRGANQIIGIVNPNSNTLTITLQSFDSGTNNWVDSPVTSGVIGDNTASNPSTARPTRFYFRGRFRHIA